MADIVDKNILDVINKNKISNQNVEITQVKIQPKKTEKTKSSAKKTRIRKPKKSAKPSKEPLGKNIKKAVSDTSVKHVKELKKHVKSLASDVRKREKALQKRHTAIQKQLGVHTSAVQDVQQQLAQTKHEVLETKAHYAHIPKLTLETQLMIESMNKLSAVVKQLLVLFNEKISKEEGPLFAKLDEITEQNEKIAEGLLAIADLVKEQQTPKAQIKEFNPYIPRQGPEPVQVRPQMMEMQQAPQLPSDLGKFQYPAQAPEQVQASEQMQPIPQFGAPLPPFSGQQPAQEQLPSRKRMLF